MTVTDGKGSFFFAFAFSLGYALSRIENKFPIITPRRLWKILGVSKSGMAA
jgi:hypothetical protein